MTYIYHKLISPKVGYILAQNHVGNELLGSPCALVGETYQEPSKNAGSPRKAQRYGKLERKDRFPLIRSISVIVYRQAYVSDCGTCNIALRSTENQLATDGGDKKRKVWSIYFTVLDN